MVIEFLISVLVSISTVPAPRLQSVTHANTPAVIASLDEILTAPNAYNGKSVRLVGQIDRCQGWGCQVCPEEATPESPMSDRCLSVSWDRQSGAAPAFGFNFDAVYRYATVELIARFDKSCLGKDAICLDRASVLLDARVIHVLKRRPSALGLGNGRDRDRLAEAPADITTDLATLLAHGIERGPAGPDYRAYTYQSDPHADNHALICRSYGKDDSAKWPIDAAAIMAPSSEDRFHCYWADRSDRHWFIHPD